MTAQARVTTQAPTPTPAPKSPQTQATSQTQTSPQTPAAPHAPATPQASAETHWPLGFVIRPSVDPASHDIEVADTVTGRRFRWRSATLSAYILAGGRSEQALRGDHGTWEKFLDDCQDRQELQQGWRHWQERRWHPSDQYYVASRRWHYADTTDLDDSIRADTLTRYLSADGPPPAEELPDGPVVSLGTPPVPGDQKVSQLLVERRSGRAYVPKPAPLGCLSGLLWHGFSEVRKRRERTGADQPLSYLDSYGSAWDIYLCVYAVDGIEPGTYRYDIRRHELRGIRPGDHRNAMIDVLQGMHSPATASWTLGVVADFPRYQWRYRHEHGLRRLYLEAGILGQELVILGGSYGLSALVTPAQKDTPYLELHGLSGDRYGAVYTLTMGQSRGSAGLAFENLELPPQDAQDA